MVVCAAPNCRNHNSRKEFRFFRFPANLERRKLWFLNCKRENWFPKTTDRLCEVHFEESQFEQHRKDNKRKLKPNAIPTLFNMKNPPPKFNRKTRVSISKHKNSTAITGNIEIEEPNSLQSVPHVIDVDPFSLASEIIVVTDSTRSLPEKSETYLFELQTCTQVLIDENKQLRMENENLNTFLKETKAEMERMKEINQKRIAQLENQLQQKK